MGRARDGGRDPAGHDGGARDLPRGRGPPARRRGARGPPARGNGNAAPPCRGAPKDRHRHRQQARPRADPVGRGRPRACPLRRRPRCGLPPASRRPRHRRGRPRAVRELPGHGPRLPGPLAAGRGRGRPAPALRDALSGRSSGGGRPVRGRPGGLRHDLRSAAPRRRRAPGASDRVPRSAPYVDRGGARHDRRLRGPGRNGDQERPELRTDGDLGGSSAVDPAAGGAPGPPDDRERDRGGHRQRARPAHRVPQRPRLPAPARRLADPGGDARSRRRIPRRDTGAVCASRAARGSRAGSPGIASPRTCRTRPTTRGR